MKIVHLAAAVLALVSAAGRADAACTVSTTGASFGTYDVFNSSVNASTGTITYRCGNGDRDILITLSKGSSSTFTTRTLRNGTEMLEYNLYRDAAFSTIWGDGTSGTTTYTIRNPPNNQDVILTVYGRVPALQDVATGSYADAVIVTINF
jgi:spore coat protein U domain-containing protein, fimbrial subunit CupE1/2/3/6